MSETDTNGIVAEERLCRACGWTEPEYQFGDPALCPHCGLEYGNMPKRERTWYRCGEWTTKNKKCEQRADGPDDTCRFH